MEKEKAQAEADKNNTGAYPEFCPLINGKCNPDCVCWFKSIIKDAGKDNWYATPAYCGNQMFWRECNI